MLTKISRLYIFFLLGIFTVIYSVIAVQSHNNFETFGWDLGYFDQLIWKLSQLKYPFSTLNFVNFLANHFSPILLINALLYKIWSDPRMLLIAQAFFVVIASLPLYLLACEKTNHNLFSFSLVFSFLLFLGTQWSILNEFHEATYAPFFLALFFYAANKSARNDLLLASILGLLFSKEEFALLAASLAVPLYFIYKKKKFAVILFIFSLIFFFFLTDFLMPYLSEMGTYQHAHLSPYAKTPSEFVHLIIKNPLLLVNFMFTPFQKIQTVVISFASFAFLPLFAPLSILVPVFEQFLMRLLYSGPQFTVFANVNHHAAPIAIGLPVASLFAAVRLIEKYPKQKNRILILFSLLLITATLSQDILLKGPIHSILKKSLFRREKWMINAQKLIQLVPKEVPVAAQNSLFPHLSQRDEIYLLPQINNAEYIAVDFHDGPNKFAPLDLSGTKILINDLLRQGNFKIQVNLGEAFLLKKVK